jgi:hypothetical protein
LIKAYRKKKTDFNIRVYGELLEAQLSESSIIQRLSCSMRLTQQSNFHQSRRLPGPTISNRNPWDEKMVTPRRGGLDGPRFTISGVWTPPVA